jgi:hypothetical protein
MKRLLLVCLWLPSSLLLVLYSFSYYLTLSREELSRVDTSIQLKKSISAVPYKMYASLPNVLGAKTVDAYYIESQDIIPDLVYDYFKKYKSPMLESSSNLVEIARKYEIDPLLLVAIAQCESNLGKKMPPDCHNPFGWGIHSKGTLCFTTWEEGYEAISKGLRSNYFDKGRSKPEDIMEMYTPASLEKGGSWAKCVSKFMGQLGDLKNSM